MAKQLQSALERNQQLDKANKNIEAALSTTLEMSDKYSAEIEKDYADKMKEFEEVFNTSS